MNHIVTDYTPIAKEKNWLLLRKRALLWLN